MLQSFLLFLLGIFLFRLAFRQLNTWGWASVLATLAFGTSLFSLNVFHSFLGFPPPLRLMTSLDLGWGPSFWASWFLLDLQMWGLHWRRLLVVIFLCVCGLDSCFSDSQGLFGPFDTINFITKPKSRMGIYVVAIFF